MEQICLLFVILCVTLETLLSVLDIFNEDVPYITEEETE